MQSGITGRENIYCIAKPEEIASLIAFLCSDDAANITGQAFRSDGGIGILIEGSKQD